MFICFQNNPIRMVRSVFMYNFAHGKRRNIMLIRYFSERTLLYLKPQQDLPKRYQRRTLDVTLVCKLTHAYDNYHLAMLHRELVMDKERTTYQQGKIDYKTFCMEFQELSWRRVIRLRLMENDSKCKSSQ